MKHIFLWMAAALISTTYSGISLAQTKGKKLTVPNESAQAAPKDPKAQAPGGPAAQPPGAQKRQDGKLDVSDLEKKYWAPKDTDFNVVQNRTYSKEKRFSGTVLFGTPTNDLFNEGTHLGLLGNYFFSERYGVELSYFSSSLGESSSVSRFRELSLGGTSPDYSTLKSQYGVSFNWVPFYSKMSFLNQKIIYFDMAFSPAISYLNYTQQTDGDPAEKNKSSIAYGIDITQYYFISKYFAVRVDLRNRWFTEKVIRFTDGSTQSDKNSVLTMFLIGGTFFF